MISKIYRRLAQAQPLKLLIGGYLGVVWLGFLLLLLPWVQTRPVSALDALFIAASAVSTTGLTTISVADHYNGAGEFLILAMIQIGGLGYMAIGSFVILGVRRRATPLEEDLVKHDFSLPKDFDLYTFIRSVVFFSLAAESIGATALYFIFAAGGEQSPLWPAIFHSVSAFSTAGFSLFDDSLAGYRDNFWLNIVIASLSYCGAIGFIVLTDVWLSLVGKKEEMTFTSQVILKFTLSVSVIGTCLIFISEPTIQDLAPDRRLLTAFFQAMTSTTTVGFNTIPVGGLSASVMTVIILLMLLGASPSGTGGGIKSTTISATYAQMTSCLRSQEKVVFQEREIPAHRVRVATASFVFYMLVLYLGIYLLTLTESISVAAVIFEATSALGTVGLSTGVTGDLSNLGKLVIIGLMFAGRVGPLSLGTALFAKEATDPDEPQGPAAETSAAGEEEEQTTDPADQEEEQEEDLAVQT